MRKIHGENTRLFSMILNYHSHFCIYDCFSYIILSLLLFFIEIYVNDIMSVFFLNFDYICESLGGSLKLTLFIRFFFISDDG